MKCFGAGIKYPIPDCVKGGLKEPAWFEKATLETNVRSDIFCTAISFDVKLIIAVFVYLQGINWSPFKFFFVINGHLLMISKFSGLTITVSQVNIWSSSVDPSGKYFLIAYIWPFELNSQKQYPLYIYYQNPWLTPEVHQSNELRHLIHWAQMRLSYCFLCPARYKKQLVSLLWKHVSCICSCYPPWRRSHHALLQI